MLGRLMLLPALLFCASASAEPRQWELDGVPVRAVSVLSDYSSAQNAAGFTLVAWAASEGAEPDVWGQLLSPAGAPLWDEGGIVLASGDLRAGLPVVGAVDEGWMIVWMDFVYSSPWGGPNAGWYGYGALRAIMIDNNGSPLWPSGRAGIEVAARTEWWYKKSATINKTQGGAIVTWMPTSDHWARLISDEGELQWDAPVLLQSGLFRSQSSSLSDLFGGVAQAWTEVRAGDTLLVVNRLLGDGTFAWNGANGVVVCTSNMFYRGVKVTGDSEGGVYVTWHRDDSDGRLFAQHVDATGTVTWQANGVLIGQYPEESQTESIAASFNFGTPDGVVMAIYTPNAGTSRLVAQKLSPTGEALWGPTGAEICDQFIYYVEAFVRSDRAGGAVYCFAKDISQPQYHIGISLQRVAGGGTVLWGDACGTEAGSDDWSNADLNLMPISVGSESAKAVWIESSRVGGAHIRCRSLDMATGTPVQPEAVMLVEGDTRGVGEFEMVKLAYGRTAVIAEAPAGWEYEITYQILDVFGEPLYGVDGAELFVENGSPHKARLAAVCPDGSGGFFVVARALIDGIFRTRVAHVNGDGQVVSDLAGEDPYPVSDNDISSAECWPDGTGGCYIAAAIYNAVFFLHSRVMRVDEACQNVWQQEVVFSDPQRDVIPIQMAPSDNGSVVLAFNHAEFMQNRIRAAKISAGGAVVWNVLVTDSAEQYDYGRIAACSDNNDGIHVVWVEGEDESGPAIRAQRVAHTGWLRWNSAGVVVSDSASFARNISIGADIPGNLTLAWSGYDGQDLDLQAQRLNAFGVVQWGAEGILLAEDEALDQVDPQLAVISDNEIYFVWYDYRNDPEQGLYGDIFATHLDARGRIRDDSFWQENGTPICDYAYRQIAPKVIADGAGGALVAWADDRTTGGWESSVFAQRLFDPIFTDAEDAPVVPSEFALSQNYPNPFNPETVIEFALPTATNATLKVFDITGREVVTLVDESLSAGIHRVGFNAKRLASGVYFYRLQAGEFVQAKKMVVLK